MCLSKSFWKFFIYISGFIFAAFGVVLLALSCVISQKEFAKAAELDSIIIGYGVAFGIVIILIGLIGWYSAKKESRYLVFLVRLLFVFACLVEPPLTFSNSTSSA